MVIVKTQTQQELGSIYNQILKTKSKQFERNKHFKKFRLE